MATAVLIKGLQFYSSQLWEKEKGDFLGFDCFQLMKQILFPLQLCEITVSREIFYIWLPSDLSSPAQFFRQPRRVIHRPAGLGRQEVGPGTSN